MNDVSISIKFTAKIIQWFLNLFEFQSVALFVKPAGPTGIVLTQGDRIDMMHGIHNMITDIAASMDKSEDEVIALIKIANPANPKEI